jgi:hypothetical protein
VTERKEGVRGGMSDNRENCNRALPGGRVDRHSALFRSTPGPVQVTLVRQITGQAQDVLELSSRLSGFRAKYAISTYEELQHTIGDDMENPSMQRAVTKKGAVDSGHQPTTRGKKKMNIVIIKERDNSITS